MPLGATLAALGRAADAQAVIRPKRNTKIEARVEAAPFHWCVSQSELPETPKSMGAAVSWQAFFGFRNQLLSRLRPFGTVGPMGEAPIYRGAQTRGDGWTVESEDPSYFINDDQLNEVERYQHVEVRSSDLMSLPVLQALWECVRLKPDWAVSIGVPSKRYVYLHRSGVWCVALGLHPMRSLPEYLSAPHAESEPAV